MKLITVLMSMAIAALILILGHGATANVPDCGQPLNARSFSQGFNQVVENYPAGNCDYLGLASSTMECMKSAERRNYQCYQIANREFYGRTLVVTPKCFACLR